MKLDKETLVKHKFWIGLGVFALLWLIAIVMLAFTAGAEIKKNKADYEKADKAIKGVKNVKSPHFLPKWIEHQDMFRRHKDVVWEKGWNHQKGLYDWPSVEDWKAPQAPGAPMEHADRVKYRDTVYAGQLQGLFDAKPIAPVEFHGGKEEKDAFLTLMAPVQWDKNNAPTREEIWLAQEDIWVKRELMRVIRQVLDEQARMVEVKVDSSEPLPAGIQSRRRFRNTTWEIDLLIKKGEQQGDQFISEHSTIKNIHPGKRTLPLANPQQEPLQFRLTQEGGTRPVDLKITGEPLPPWEPPASKDKPDGKEQEKPHVAEFNWKEPLRVAVTTLDFRKPFAVAQVLDWYGSPIKRLDSIKLGYQSSRTITMALKPNTNLPQDGPKEEAAAPAPGGAKGGQAGPGGPGGPGKGGLPGPGMGGSGMQMGSPNAPPGQGGAAATGDDAGAKETPTAKIERARYIQVTPQCRHLPLGMVLVLDQAVVPDVLAAIASSRLRIQVTQWQIQHVHNIKQEHPTAPSGGQARADNPMPPGPGIPPGPGGFPGNAGQPAKAAGDEEDPNLVELAVYGIAALYEPFDASKKVEAGPGGPDKPPAAGGPAAIGGPNPKPGPGVPAPSGGPNPKPGPGVPAPSGGPAKTPGPGGPTGPGSPPNPTAPGTPSVPGGPAPNKPPTPAPPGR
jgi:hypothetical protein